MTAQELLILSFFDKSIPRQLDEKSLTTEMIEAGIGSNDAANYPYYNLVNQLINQRLLVLFKDSSRTSKGLSLAVGPTLFVLSDNAVQILQGQEEKRKREAFVTELEFNKLKTEHDLLSKQLADYNKIKKQASWAIILSIISTIAAIISLIINK